MHIQAYAGKSAIVGSNLMNRPEGLDFKLNIEDQLCWGLPEQETFKILTEV